MRDTERDRRRERDRERRRRWRDFLNFKLITFYLENNMYFKHTNKVLWPAK